MFNLEKIQLREEDARSSKICRAVAWKKLTYFDFLTRTSGYKSHQWVVTGKFIPRESTPFRDSWLRGMLPSW